MCVVYIEREKRGPNAESETPSTGYPVLGAGWGEGGERSLTEPFIEGIVTRELKAVLQIFDRDPDPGSNFFFYGSGS